MSRANSTSFSLRIPFSLISNPPTSSSHSIFSFSSTCMWNWFPFSSYSMVLIKFLRVSAWPRRCLIRIYKLGLEGGGMYYFLVGEGSQRDLSYWLLDFWFSSGVMGFFSDSTVSWWLQTISDSFFYPFSSTSSLSFFSLSLISSNSYSSTKTLSTFSSSVSSAPTLASSTSSGCYDIAYYIYYQSNVRLSMVSHWYLLGMGINTLILEYMFSKQATELGKLLLKYRPKHSNHTQDTNLTSDPLSEPLASQRTNKYSNDYTQFQKLADELEPETKQNTNKSQKPSTNPTEYFAHTHDKRKERQLYERSTKEKLENAEYFKNEGNKAYSEQQFQKASYCYQKALVHFDYTFPDTEREEKVMKQLQEKCHQNMGLSLYKLGNKEEGIFHFKQALKYNPRNMKSLYTLAKISLEMDDFGKCQAYAGEAKLVDSKNKEVEGILAELVRKKERYSEKTKKMSEMMLAK